MKAEVDNTLQVVLTHVQVEALLLDRDAFLVGIETVLGEAPVRAHGNSFCHLLLNFDKVPA